MWERNLPFGKNFCFISEPQKGQKKKHALLDFFGEKKDIPNIKYNYENNLSKSYWCFRQP